MESFRYRLNSGITLFVVWLLLVYPQNQQELIAGAVISVLLVLLPLPNLEIYKAISLAPKKIAVAVVFLFVFLWAVVKSNIDVALRVLQPVIPIKPGIVKVTTKLTSKLGRLILANAITLTPGTITVDIQEEHLYIHWIAVDAEDTEEATKKIVSQFEKYLEVIFG